MITLHESIRILNPSIITIRGEDAFDEQGNQIAYDKSAAKAKLIELQNAETAKQEAEVVAKESALSKLTALGLTADEVKAILGTI
jgi:hypothetical protein